MIETFANYIHNKNRHYIIFDIGSRDCMQSIEFYHHFPNARIYAFECNPNTLDICKENIKEYTDRITLIEGAVSDYDGTIIFHPINQQKTVTTWPDGNPGASSIFKSNGEYPVEQYVQDTIPTRCHRLDSVMKKHSILNVDIIWMDLQGAELLALKGLGKYLENVQYIHTEVSHREMYSGQVMFHQLNSFITTRGFTLLNNLSLSDWQEDAVYEKKLFDIVIPLGPNDREVIEQQIVYTKQNVIGYRNIFLISYDPSIHIEGCTTIDETLFPFSLETVIEIHGQTDRVGWYLQQLLKLYAGTVIPNILERYLVIDADTFFLKPTTFILDNKCLYNYGNEYHKEYFEHMFRMDPTMSRVHSEQSGICHHMIFETKYISEMIKKVEEIHKDIFYSIFLKCVAEEVQITSGASEYEMYYNYMLQHHRDKITIRPLKWDNVKTLDAANEMDYVSLHWYNRSI